MTNDIATFKDTAYIKNDLVLNLLSYWRYTHTDSEVDGYTGLAQETTFFITAKNSSLYKINYLLKKLS